MRQLQIIQKDSILGIMDKDWSTTYYWSTCVRACVYVRVHVHACVHACVRVHVHACVCGVRVVCVSE